MDIGLEQPLAGFVAYLQSLVLFYVYDAAVREFFRASGNCQVVLVADRSSGDFFKPVCFMAIEVDGLGRSEILDGVFEFPRRHGRSPCLHGLYGNLSVVLNRGVAGAGALGGYDYHPVCASGSVDSGRRPVLEHIDGFDFLEIDAPYVGVKDPVDDNQRALSCRQGIGAPEKELERCFGISSIGIYYGKTGDLSLEHASGIGEGSDIEIFCFEACN